MKKTILALCLLIFTSCAAHKTMKTYEPAPALLEKADGFYSFIVQRENGIWHNDLDPEFRKFFADTESFYDFMDSFLFMMRRRNIYRNTVTQYYIQGVEMAEDGNSATVKVKFLSRDAYLLYRKIEATQKWEKTYDVWYPRKIEAPELNWYEKYTEMYGVPPIH